MRLYKSTVRGSSPSFSHIHRYSLPSNYPIKHLKTTTQYESRNSPEPPSSSAYIGSGASGENMSQALGRVSGRASQDSSVRELPLTFALWTTHNPAKQAPSSNLSHSAALVFDILDYSIYLDSRRFDPAYSARSINPVGLMHRDERAGWDFVNTERQDIPPFREWEFNTRNRAMSYEDVHRSGRGRYRAAVAAYADMLRQVPEDLDAFLSARDVQAEIQRRELCYQSWSYPDPPASGHGGSSSRTT
jgi:hypothetical protein